MTEFKDLFPNMYQLDIQRMLELEKIDERYRKKCIKLGLLKELPENINFKDIIIIEGEQRQGMSCTGIQLAEYVKEAIPKIDIIIGDENLKNISGKAPQPTMNKKSMDKFHGKDNRAKQEKSRRMGY